MWSSAAETARADAYRFAFGLVPERGLIMGRGTARIRVVRLGGPKVRKARRNATRVEMFSCIVIQLLHLWLSFGVGHGCARCNDS